MSQTSALRCLQRALLVLTGVCGFAVLPLAHAHDNDHGRSHGHDHGKKGSCDDRLATAFARNRDAQVLLVKSFRAGEPIALANTPATPAPPVAPVDLCLVKLLVGPGHPGTEGAPSTSRGIGIEVWLPAPEQWNGRIRDIGSGGWAGGDHADPTRIGSRAIVLAGAAKGYAGSASDHGHSNRNIGGSSGSFAMKEDGTINTALWHDFAERSLEQMALATRAAVKTFYGKRHDYAYWDGYSTGGRQGYMLAQKYPHLYDGILAGAPAFNWTRFITNELYPQIVMQQFFGAPLPTAKLNFVSTRSVASCDALGLGFILDPLQCRYDPTRDAQALCAGVAGNGVVGASTDANCVNVSEAAAVNRMWYGQTADGSYVDPQVDNAPGPYLATSNHLWFGLARGTSLGLLAGAAQPFTISSDVVALSLQNPTIAHTNLIPGMAHDGSFSRTGTFDPATGTITSPNKVPQPQAVAGRDELFVALRNWVEKGRAPGRIDVSSANGSVTMPICVYPKQAQHDGVGDPKVASSYRCR